MGRQPSITEADVLQARSELIAANKPHGIIAIRRQIGRGSPQLISRFLKQLEDASSPAGATLAINSPNAPSTSNINRAWQTISTEIENLLAPAKPRDTTICAPHSAEIDAKAHLKQSDPKVENTDQQHRISQLEQILASQQQKLSQLESINKALKEQLMQQQDLFDSWRHEQHAERQLLKNQLEQLTQATSGKVPRKRRKRAEQLDLYDDNSD